MRSFWSFIGNGKYSIGCTGQTVYLFDGNGKELAKFKDLIYAYKSAVSPSGDIFVVKTTEGRLGVYSFDPPALIKKFRFSSKAAQDDGYCFSPDGQLFYNIERDGLRTALSIYNTSDFSLKDKILDGDPFLDFSQVEYDAVTDMIYLLGYFRDKDKIAHDYFVGQLIGNELKNTLTISNNEYDYYEWLIDLRLMGFTEKAYGWGYLDLDLDRLKSSDHSLAKLWKYYHDNR